MKEQLRQEINLLWEQILLQKEQGLSAKDGEARLERLVVILRDMEAADAYAADAASRYVPARAAHDEGPAHTSLINKEGRVNL